MCVCVCVFVCVCVCVCVCVLNTNKLPQQCVVQTFKVMMYFNHAIDILYNISLPLFIGGEKRSKEIDDKSSQYCFPWGIREHPLTVSLLAAFLAIGGNKGDTD